MTSLMAVGIDIGWKELAQRQCPWRFASYRPADEAHERRQGQIDLSDLSLMSTIAGALLIRRLKTSQEEHGIGQHEGPIPTSTS